MHKITQIDNTEFDSCDSTAVFILDNGTEQFAVHLEVVVSCLKFASDHGLLPSLPAQWWEDVIRLSDGNLLQISG